MKIVDVKSILCSCGHMIIINWLNPEEVVCPMCEKKYTVSEINRALQEEFENG